MTIRSCASTMSITTSPITSPSCTASRYDVRRRRHVLWPQPALSRKSTTFCARSWGCGRPGKAQIPSFASRRHHFDAHLVRFARAQHLRMCPTDHMGIFRGLTVFGGEHKARGPLSGGFGPSAFLEPLIFEIFHCRLRPSGERPDLLLLSRRPQKHMLLSLLARPIVGAAAILNSASKINSTKPTKGSGTRHHPPT